MTLPTSITEDPEPVDSEDLTDEQIEGAPDTNTEGEWQKWLIQTIKNLGWIEKVKIEAQEMRRRGDDLFIRTTLTDGVTEKVLVARTNWLQGTT